MTSPFFDSIAVISDVLRQTLADLFGITDNVIKISNSVDSEKMNLLCKEKITLPNKMLFTTLGWLDYNKNQIIIIKSCKRSKKAT